MSLRAFHLFFIAAAFLCLAFAARWASGGNPAGLVTPWLRAASLAGMLLLAAYFAWRVRKA